MKDIRAKLLAAFRVEYKEHLEHIRGALAAVDPEAGELPGIDEVFRRAHSLKGAARAADLRPVETLAHRLETLFSQMRAGERRLDADSAKVISAVADAVEDWVEAFGDDPGAEPPPDPSEALATIDALLAGATSGDPPAKAPEAKPERKPETPAPAKKAAAKPQAAPKKPAPAEPAAPAAAPQAVASADTVRLQVTSLDQLLRSAGQLAGENLGLDTVSRSLKELEQAVAALDSEWRALRETTPALQSRAGGIGLDAAQARRTDFITQQLHSLRRNMRTARQLQQRHSWTFGRLGRDLQEKIRITRMVPADNIFGGFRKMVRDLARDSGKDVTVSVSGLDVEADRLVLQALKDPVMHMLRNAVHHGIETAAAREAIGKDPSGRIALSFEVQGNWLVVTVEDDGRGIDIEAVREKAMAMGLMSPEETIAANRRDVLRHIFHPGFSTAAHVNDVAGRGMGMSVVHEAVVGVNGSLEVIEDDRPGTAFRLLVPLSVSTQRILLVRCGDQTFGLPANGIERLLRIRLSEVRSVENQSVVTIAGRPRPLIGLADLLDIGDKGVETSNGMVNIVVLRSQNASVALAVDSLIGMREALIKDLGLSVPHGSAAVGGVLGEDGGVSVVLSTFGLLEIFQDREGSGMVRAQERKGERRVPTIMVVDDSMTTRTLEKSILEAHGYRVHTAVDGLDALLQLRGAPTDLVVADVEMPRIDGFSLLKELKRDPALSHIPVILVTSLRRDEDLERGYELGAEAYLIKQKFDQTELLETIEQIL